MNLTPYLIALAALYSVLLIATENMPDPVIEPQQCTCAGKADCQTAVFGVDRDRRAFCALGSDDHCCDILPDAGQQ